MRLALLLVTLGLLSVCCQSKKHILSEREYTQVYYDSLVKRFKDVKFTIVDDRTLFAKVGDLQGKLSIDNAYKDYTGSPDSLASIVHRYVNSAGEAFAPAPAITVDQVVPVIKPVTFLDDTKKIASDMGAKKDFDGLYEKYNDDLIIAYARDSKNSISYMSNDDLKKLSIPADSLRAIATRNLANIIPNINKQGGKGIFMITAGGDYEACLILLDHMWTKENFPVKGDIVVAIPNRDLLLITGSEDKENLQKLEELVNKSYATGNYKITDRFFKWTGKKFVRFDN